MALDKERLQGAATRVRSGISNRLGDLRWFLLVRGMLAVALGVATLFSPEATLILLIRLIAVYALFDGVVSLLGAIRARDFGTTLAPGLISVLVGVILLLWPDGTGRTLLVLVGLVLAIWPGSGAVTLSWVIGIAALLIGALLIYLALRLRLGAAARGQAPRARVISKKARMTKSYLRKAVPIISCLFTTVVQAQSEESVRGANEGGSGAEELAKKLANPVASLISVPLQNNFDFGGGFKDDAFRYTLNIQPVVPISLNKDWNLISRTIFPLVYQEDVLAPDITPTDVDPNDDQFGLGDTVQSLFLSPSASDPIWGIGPVLLLPTATDDVLGTEKWGAGPTAVVLKQTGPWTYGMLANHIWSFAGDSNRTDVNATFLQPFLSYTTVQAWTYSLNTESTRNWEANEDEWTVPINAQVTKVLKLGGQLVSVGGGIRYYVAGPDTAPDWGLRFIWTFLFPK